jgi:hypothetical protein
MRIIDLALDERINGYCATAVCSYEWYLAATTGAEGNLEIQRSIIKDSKAYRTLRADLKRGCILPPLVIAISGIDLPEGLTAVAITDEAQIGVFKEALQAQLNDPRPADTYIIDGLQRTNALRQTREELEEEESEEEAAAEEGHGAEEATPENTQQNLQLTQFLARPLRVEIWLNIPFGAIAYRMLLLNAGQKPMNIKRQVEVLSMKLREDLSDIPEIEIILSLSSQRRTRPGQFFLGNVSQAFQAWLQGTPNIDVRNTVMEQLLAESAIDTLGTSLSGRTVHDDFKWLMRWFVDLDHLVFATDSRFFANDTVLLGISAAVGTAQRSDTLRERMRPGLDLLRNEAAHNNIGALGIDRFNELRQGVDVRKVNVGVFTREMVYRAFQEFFVSNGTKSMEECWAFGAGQF